MKRVRSNSGQFQIDFLANFRRMLVSMGSPDNLPVNESLFLRMTDQWEATRVLPADLLFTKSPIEAIVFRMKKLDADTNRLQFPTELIGGEIRGEQGLTGFAATLPGAGLGCVTRRAVGHATKLVPEHSDRSNRSWRI